jgi:hypothetical protein
MNKYSVVMGLNGKKIVVAGIVASDFLDMLENEAVKRQLNKGARVIRCERKKLH